MFKILVVDDHEPSRRMLSRRLERRGYDVVTAEDGQAAVDRARADMPDLILMDMSLPIKDGWTATKEIKGDVGLAHIRVLALTAHAMESDRVKAFDAGCDDFDTKPVEFDRLLAKVDALLGGDAGPVPSADQPG